MMKTPLRIFQGAFLLIFFSTQLAFTQTSDEYQAVQKELQVLQKEIQVIKEDQLKIRRDVEKLRRKHAVVVNYADDPFKGDKDAKITLLDFSDFG